MTGNTHFVFRHKIFNVDGSYFSSRAGGRDSCLNLPLGELTAALAIPTLRREFGIAADSEDGRRLDIVERALRHLRVIRVNEAIPNELLDGSASWSVEDRHRAAAQRRLALNLVDWAAGRKRRAGDLHAVARDFESSAAKRKVRAAIGKVARRLCDSGDALAEVERRIAFLAHELSYIEGLRERFRTIRDVMSRVHEASIVQGQGRAVRDDIERVRVLLSYAFAKIDSEFDLVDRQQEDILSVLSDVTGHVELVRGVRDAIHYELMAWDEIVAGWQAYGRGDPAAGAQQAVERTYHFLAQRYAITQVW